MPVTELGLIPSATPGTVSEELVKALQEGIEGQGEWLTAQSPSAGGPAATRGAALYQQREDRGVVLITAHWDSAEQHYQCIASEMNRRSMGALAPLVVRTEIKVSHVNNVSLFDSKTIEAGFLSVVRIAVGKTTGGRDKVEKIWKEDPAAAQLLKTSSGFEHTAGWLVDKEVPEDRDELVVVGAWRDEDALGRFASESGGADWDKVWKDVALNVDIKTYVRLA